MKVIIDQNGIKREIVGPFEICVDQSTLVALIKRLCAARDSRGEEAEPMSGGFAYGWIKIYDEPDRQGGANVSPKPWAD